MWCRCPSIYHSQHPWMDFGCFRLLCKSIMPTQTLQGCNMKTGLNWELSMGCPHSWKCNSNAARIIFICGVFSEISLARSLQGCSGMTYEKWSGLGWVRNYLWGALAVENAILMQQKSDEYLVFPARYRSHEFTISEVSEERFWLGNARLANYFENGYNLYGNECDIVKVCIFFATLVQW